MSWKPYVSLALASIVCSSGGCNDSESSSDPTSDAIISNADAAIAPDKAGPVRRRVFSFVDNRVLAHEFHANGLVIWPASVTSTKYKRFGKGGVWKTRNIAGRRVAAPRRTGWFRVPILRSPASAMRSISLRVYSKRRDVITLRFNKRRLSRRLRAGFQTLRFSLDEQDVIAGMNDLRVRFRSRRSYIEWLAIGGENPTPPRSVITREAQTTVALKPQSRLAYYVHIPHGASLVTQLASQDCNGLLVGIDGQDGHAAYPVGAGEHRVTLGDFADQVVRLEFSLAGCTDWESAVGEFEAYITLPGRPQVARTSAMKRPKNVIVWLMDTLRGDRVRFVNPDARAEIPNLAALARSGATFRQFYVQGNESQVSHASLWTSLYPVNHKICVAGHCLNFRLSRRHRKLPQEMAAAGRSVVGVTANTRINSWTGYTPGFDHFENLMRITGRHKKRVVSAEEVITKMLAALTRYRDRPFFGFIGTFDTHKPWVVREPWASSYQPQPYKGPLGDEIWGRHLGQKPGTMTCRSSIPASEFDRVLAVYDSNISYQDAMLGRLIAKLKEWGIYEDTAIIVTSDHGEELWERPKRCGHGTSSRESLVHVPLLVHYPPMVPQAVVTEGAEGVDILPTILDLLGRPLPKAAQGASLLPLIRGVGKGYPRPSFSSYHHLAYTMRIGRWKAWVGRQGRPRVFDVGKDPHERTDIAPSRAFVRQFLVDAFSLFLAKRRVWKKSSWGVASNMTPAAARDLL